MVCEVMMKTMTMRMMNEEILKDPMLVPRDGEIGIVVNCGV